MAKKIMTPKDKAIYEHKKRQLSAQRRKKRAGVFRYIRRVFAMALIAAALFVAVLFATIYINFNSAPEKYEYSLSVTVDGNSIKTGKDIVSKDNKCYISLVSLSEIMGFSVSGDVREMCAVFDNGDKISFILDTDIYMVNGLARTADGVSFMNGGNGDVFVPINFISNSFDGVTLKRDGDGKKVKYSLDIEKDFSLSFAKEQPIALPNMTAVVPKAEPVNDFICDLSEYEKYMNPENVDEYITLINSENTLDSSYIPDDLIEISYTRRDGRATQKMRLAAAKALDAMFMEMYANGFTDVTVTSAYRSYDYQKQLFDNKLNYYKQYYDSNTAYTKTAKENAVPGTSEHQSGLCADLHNLAAASQSFEAEKAYKWLVANCADFGFILRYPKNKQDITQIIYEPWHYRFVGRYHAQKIMQSGLCLEEYCKENNLY